VHINKDGSDCPYCIHVPDPGSANAQEIGIQRVPHDTLHLLLVKDHNMQFDDAVRVHAHMLHSQSRTGLVRQRALSSSNLHCVQCDSFKAIVAFQT